MNILRFTNGSRQNLNSVLSFTDRLTRRRFLSSTTICWMRREPTGPIDGRLIAVLTHLVQAFNIEHYSVIVGGETVDALLELFCKSHDDSHLRDLSRLCSIKIKGFQKLNTSRLGEP
ncbi:hypothetical protein BpHYR1_019419 [Brachionus plicatilis]|uniref:Uncharacterized protein n=1 Tax=Brachionus plicatilis TaxID=10195 RepID=A0A3M7RDK6_BRAPC|nr:hypothetical protein BpHYR1_019419 [Brachionus plicatilis]